jgi:hypothetical protein
MSSDGAYFHWLLNKVVPKPEVVTPTNSFNSLMAKLFDTEFVWLLSGDDNRSADGIELRLYYSRETNAEYDSRWDMIGCSMLEMLIAFSYRAEFASYSTAMEWFWMFLQNLDLADQNDSNYDDNFVSGVLLTFIWRTYDPDGRRGMFPLKEPQQDQRDVELWYQFSAYWAENSKFRRL